MSLAQETAAWTAIASVLGTVLTGGAMLAAGAIGIGKLLSAVEALRGSMDELSRAINRLDDRIDHHDIRIDRLEQAGKGKPCDK